MEHARRKETIWLFVSFDLLHFLISIFLISIVSNFLVIVLPEDPLGEGAFGKAIRVLNPNTGEVKVIKDMEMKETHFSGEQINELFISRRFDSPYIVKVEDTFIDQLQGGIHLYLLMEWCNGPRLAEVIKGRIGAGKELEPDVCFLLFQPLSPFLFYDLVLIALFHIALLPFNCRSCSRINNATSASFCSQRH